MSSGTRLVLILVLAAAAVAALRFLCVPVGSFRAGLEELGWGMPADSVVARLGPPNRICATARVDHLLLPAEADTARLRRTLGEVTAERWVYTDRPPPDEPPRDDDPACEAPPAATELGFDAAGRLRWISREALQTPVEVDSRVY